jgi:hypothetical protein
MHVEATNHCAMIQALRREGARGAWLRLLTEVLRLAGPAAQFERHSERPWSSTTFSGARHTIRLSFKGAAQVGRGETFIACLPDHEFTLAGRIVADASVTSAEHSLIEGPSLVVEAELLVLDDA